MSPGSPQHEELLQLLESLCEDCLDRDGVARLEELVLGDAAARQLYLEYISLHGTRYWEAAGGVAESETHGAGDEQVVEATRRPTRRRLGVESRGARRAYRLLRFAFSLAPSAIQIAVALLL